MRTTNLTRNILAGALMAVSASLGVMSLGGCETANPGVTNTMGRFDIVVDAPVERTTNAARDVLETDYKFALLTAQGTNVDGHIEAQTAQGTKINVWVARESDKASRVSVRVGLAGDEAMSQEILNKIRDRSKTITDKMRDAI